mmetsp:Transcript_2507/g.5660  ORF Transcript_2507/g.5660 Transcript_2507/m.5660 type:complete len:100 (+) Transcript_2507:562-861(+)
MLVHMPLAPCQDAQIKELHRENAQLLERLMSHMQMQAQAMDSEIAQHEERLASSPQPTCKDIGSSAVEPLPSESWPVGGPATSCDEAAATRQYIQDVAG